MVWFVSTWKPEEEEREGCLGNGGWGLDCPCEELKAESPGPMEIPEQVSSITELAFRSTDRGVWITVGADQAAKETPQVEHIDIIPSKIHSGAIHAASRAADKQGG